MTLLLVGLYPYRINLENRVAGAPDGRGLVFSDHGMLLSDAGFTWLTTDAPGHFVLELCFIPRALPSLSTQKQVIFTLLDDLDMPSLVLYQEGYRLILADRVTNADGERWYNDFSVTPHLEMGQSVSLRIESRGDQTQIEINGVPFPLESGFPIPVGKVGETLSGQLLFGSDPAGMHPWSGTLQQVKLFDRGKSLAIYRFDERLPKTLINHASGRVDLHIPEHFNALRPALDWVDTTRADVVINVLGFIPLGMLLALGTARWQVRLLMALVAGFAISLGIELTQTLMITRASSALDLLLNTAGSAVGAVIMLVLRPECCEKFDATRR